MGEAALVALDERQEQALDTLLGGPLPPDCHARAACGVADAGLGRRKARAMRAPAFVASRTESRPVAEELCATMPEQWWEALFGQWGAGH